MILSDKLPLDIKIEKGVPIPPKKHLYTKGLRHEFEVVKRMEIGDSFVVKTAAQKSKCQQKAYRKGLRLMSRTLKEDGFRLWRVK